MHSPATPDRGRRHVAGYDLTFGPVKSVSALWAVASPGAEAIEGAREAAVRHALAFIEREVLFTREARNGARQVEIRGLIATAFTHGDSRAGDPDLHTPSRVSRGRSPSLANLSAKS
jgi:conjugative relaxase-like TrwC/TraI family protein